MTENNEFGFSAPQLISHLSVLFLPSRVVTKLLFIYASRRLSLVHHGS